MEPFLQTHRNRIADWAQSTVWIGVSIAGLSLASLALFYAYAVMLNIFSAGVSFESRLAVSISVAGLAAGVALSLGGFAVGSSLQRPLASNSRSDETIAA